MGASMSLKIEVLNEKGVGRLDELDTPKIIRKFRTIYDKVFLE